MSEPSGATVGRPSVCVVIPVRNGGDDLHDCLRAIRNLQPRPDGVIVVDDHSTDKSAEAALASGVTVLHLDGPGGPSAARNMGARSTRCDVIYFVDADVAVHVNVIGRVQDEFARDPSLSALIGSYDDTPGKPNFLSQYKNLLHHYVHQRGAEEASTFWGACGAIRREAFEAVGGFDERWTCIEDIELGYRLRAAGYRIKLVKALQVKHLKQWTPASLLRTDICVRALPWSRLILARKQIANDLNVDRASRWSIICAFGLVASLIVSMLRAEALALAACCAVLLLVLNAHVYAFFWRVRGASFAMRALPWHWIYFLYSGAAFGVATIDHLLGRRAAGAGLPLQNVRHAGAR